MYLFSHHDEVPNEKRSELLKNMSKFVMKKKRQRKG